MERKIGEIFEFGGEWYQCVKSASCDECAFLNSNCIDNPSLKCSVDDRNDNCSVIFKKLEKWGEPIEFARGLYFQRYQLADSTSFYEGDTRLFFNAPTNTFVYIEIKTKEDMSNTETLWYGPDKKEAKSLKLSNLKPFSLEAAKSGKPVCTRDGRKARILCYDFKQNEEYPILVAVENKDGKECALLYSNDGISEMYKSSNNELAMFPEKKEGWVNVYCDCDGANITKDDNIYSSKEAAMASAQVIDRDNYVATTIINWEG